MASADVINTGTTFKSEIYFFKAKSYELLNLFHNGVSIY